MANVVMVLKSGWNELGSNIEELYGMVHSLNDFLSSDQIDIARREASDIEKEVIKVLDLYNRIESS